MQHFDKIKVGEQLQCIRKDRNLVLRDLVCQDLSLTTLSRIESGYPFISNSKYELFAEKLGESLDTILRNESSENMELKRLRSKLISIEHYIDFDKVDEALKQLEAIQLDPHHLYAPMIHFLTGKALTKAKRWRKAKKELWEAIRLSQQHSSDLNTVSISYNQLSLVYFFEEEDSSSALHCADNALQTFNPNGQRAYLKETYEINKALFLVNLQRHREAFDILFALSQNNFISVQLSSSKATACELLARIHLSDRDYEQALSYCHYGLEVSRSNHLHDQSFGLWNVLGKIQIEMGSVNEAEVSLKTALEFRSHLINDDLIAATFTEMGYLYIREQNWQAAIDSIKKAIEIAKSTRGLRYIDALISLGDLQLKQKLYEDAIDPYEKALVLSREKKLDQKEYEILIKLCSSWRALDSDKYLFYLQKMHTAQINLGLECQISC